MYARKLSDLQASGSQRQCKSCESVGPRPIVTQRLGNQGTGLLLRTAEFVDPCKQYGNKQQCEPNKTLRRCGWGKSGVCRWVSIKHGCTCVGSLKPPIPEPVRVPELAEQEALERLRVRTHPDFGDYADRLPYMEGPPGREIVVALEEGLFLGAVAGAAKLRLESARRLLRVDPRGAPFIQVEPVLIGGALVAGIVSLPLLAFMLGPVLIPMLEAAVAAVASAASATAAAVTAAVETAAASWGVATVTRAAAAGIIARLVAGGSSEAEAAEAVKPILDKRIVAVADISGRRELANLAPGQSVSVGGQSFRAIMLLTAGRSQE